MEIVKGERELELLKNIFKQYKSKNLCDIGCGSGELVRYLNKNKFRAFGFDIKIEKPVTDKLFIASAKEIAFKPFKFDTFVFKQSMHHIDKDYQQELIEKLTEKEYQRIFIIEASIGEGTYEKIKSIVFPEREMRLSVLETLHKIRSNFKVSKVKTYGKEKVFDNFEHFFQETIAENEKTVWNREIEKVIKSIFDFYKGRFYQQMDVYLVERRFSQ
ncbi:hypothetical protein TTHT_1980 [Thermotomaculum hydrothermale]|uniref:Methyltransferase type 11 n=1 Tax=Thermotomaculum hydrothermale TaxID=981385 RepID=A0A7R6PGM8_9BACT|nr:methyltransferase domain-containing protein [Thermotomaculum hydrothermale]BBB33423.1 hypothetical protein TTHT_1980 [Thermotomaculum hydrothermale]